MLVFRGHLAGKLAIQEFILRYSASLRGARREILTSRNMMLPFLNISASLL